MLQFNVKFNNTSDKPELEIVYNSQDTSLEAELLKHFLEMAGTISASTTNDSLTGKSTVKIEKV